MAGHRHGQVTPSTFPLFALNPPSNEQLLMTLHAGSVAQARRPRRASVKVHGGAKTTPANSLSYLPSPKELVRKPVPARGTDVDTLAVLPRTARRNSTGSVSSAFSWQESIFNVRRLSHAAPIVNHVVDTRAECTQGRVWPSPHPHPLRSHPVWDGPARGVGARDFLLGRGL